MTTIEQNIQTCGLVTELTKSQNENFEIIKPTHQEALTEAIKKANEIYNGL